MTTTCMDETMERCEVKRADFCHAIDNRPSKEQIRRYYQRDFTPSHVYRLGLHLFKKREKLCRRRLISSTRVLPSGDLAPRKVTKAKLAPESCNREAELTTFLTELPSDHSQYSSGYHQQTAANRLRYETFLAQRVAMRKELAVVGITKNWLLSKQRTPLEERQYQIIMGKKKSSATLMQKDQTQTTDLAVTDTMFKTTDLSAKRDDECLSMKDRVRQYKDATNLEECDRLKEYCEQKGVHIDITLAKRALLLPSDKPDSQIVVRQPSTSIRLYFDLATKEMKTLSSTQNTKSYGHVRQIQRGPGRKKAESINLSTGICNVQANVDCWLGFKKYQEISREIHRKKCEPKTNLFWPGLALDVLRLPEMDGKARSLESIFKPVIKSNSNTKVQVVSWPENVRGYVQSGNSHRKNYHI